MPEVLAPEQLHDQKRHALVHAVVEDLHDVGTAERRGGLRLAAKPIGALFRGSNRRVHQLDRDVRTQREVLGQPDRTHAPLAELLLEPKAVGQDPTLHLPSFRTTGPSSASISLKQRVHGWPAPARLTGREPSPYFAL